MRSNNKRKLRFKKRRTLTSEELFKKKAIRELFITDISIRNAFPDPKERLEYIEALIQGLEKEPMLEI